MWQAQAVQLALFCQYVDGVIAQDLFTNGFGRDPDVTQRNRMISPANPFLSIAGGSVDRLNYTVQIQTGRIDVHVTPNIPSEFGVENLAPLFDMEPVLDEMVGFVGKTVSQLPGVVRVAMVGNLMSRVDDYNAAAVAVSAMIGADVARPGISDLMFQINRKKQMTHGQVMNRLVRVSVAEIQAVSVPRQGEPRDVIPLNRVETMASLQLDFNTVPSPTVLAVDVVIPLIEEIKREILRVSDSDNPVAEVLNND